MTFDLIVRHFVLARLVEARYHVLCDLRMPCLPLVLFENELTQWVVLWKDLHLTGPVVLEELGHFSVGRKGWVGFHGWRGPSHVVYVLYGWKMGLMSLMELRGREELMSSSTYFEKPARAG